MRKIVAAVAILGLYSFAPHSLADDGQNAPINRVKIFNADLASAIQDIRKTLFESKTPISFESGAVAQNCAEYLNLALTNQTIESIRNAEIRSEYLICDGARLISSKPFALEKHAVLTIGAMKAVYENLDIRSFPSSLRNRADDQNHTLKTLFPTATVRFNRDSVEIETDEQFFALQIVARVNRAAEKDRKGLPTEEWIAWVSDEMKEGNYKSYRTLVIEPSGSASQRPYNATLYP